MILDNHLDVAADPDAVFALVNDVERVAGCLPGAVLDGKENGDYLGRVRFTVGPIKAEYAGKIRFTEVDDDGRRLRLSARGADSHGNGDAEADVTLTVGPGPQGAVLDLQTDLMVRGKIAQFGKGAITTVSGRVLDQFAHNLAAQLQRSLPAPDGTPPARHVAAPSGSNADEPLDGLTTLLPPNVGRYAAGVGLLAVAFFQGWLLGRVRTQDKLIEELQRDR